MAELTPGAIAALSSGTKIKPVVQVVDLKSLPSTPLSARYTLVLSDGVHFEKAILADQYNSLVVDRSIQRGSILRLNEYIKHVVEHKEKDSNIIVILNVEVVHSQAGIVGHPQPWPSSSAAAPAGQASGAGKVEDPVSIVLEVEQMCKELSQSLLSRHHHVPARACDVGLTPEESAAVQVVEALGLLQEVEKMAQQLFLQVSAGKR